MPPEQDPSKQALEAVSPPIWPLQATSVDTWRLAPCLLTLGEAGGKTVWPSICAFAVHLVKSPNIRGDRSVMPLAGHYKYD